MNDQNLSRGELSRNAIVEAAHDLFVHQGFHGTSMRQIAQKAGIALGGLYNHFESKDRVFEAVFLAYHPYHEVIPSLQEARTGSIDEFSRDAISRMIAAMKDRPDFLNLMFIEVVEFNSVHAGELFASLMPKIAQIMDKVIKGSQDRLRPIPPLILMRFYFGLFFSYFLTERIFSDTAPPEFREMAEEYFVDIFLRGVLRRDGEEARPASIP